MNKNLVASILSVMLITVQSQATIKASATRTSADVFLCASGFAHNAVGWNTAEPRAQERANCYASARSMLLDIVSWDREGQHHEVPVWQSPDSQAFFFVSGMAIDADGAPNAYHPDDTGI